MFDVQYFINAEKKIVVAKITGTETELCCELRKKGFEGIPAYIPNEFIGKAKCSPDDVFDVKKGQKIAFKRAYYKYVKAKHTEIVNFAKWVEEQNKRALEEFGKMAEKYEQSMERRLKEIENIIKE